MNIELPICSVITLQPIDTINLEVSSRYYALVDEGFAQLFPDEVRLMIEDLCDDIRNIVNNHGYDIQECLIKMSDIYIKDVSLYELYGKYYK